MSLLIPEKLLDMLGVRYEEGWVGAFSRKQFPSAIPNGTPIVKVKDEDGDAHRVGARGVVLGSIQALPTMPIFYFVEWENAPRVALGVVDWKIAPISH